MLTDKEVKILRKEIGEAKNPLFFFDDDQDGLCSFLLLYKINREGKGTMVKSAPILDLKFLYKVKENNPDKVFILDMPIVKQEFLDEIKVPVFWIDHHQPLKLKKVTYFNPRIKNPNIYCPTTRIAYQINPDKENLWIAMVGCIGDYHLPDFTPEFIKEYPNLLNKKSTIDDAIYKDKIGELVRIFSFLFKGKTSDTNKCVKILTRIKSPYEILEQSTPAGKYLYKKFENVNKRYFELINKAKEKKN